MYTLFFKNTERLMIRRTEAYYSVDRGSDISSSISGTLVSLHPRINLSPFTKDFRGEEHYNESIIIF